VETRYITLYSHLIPVKLDNGISHPTPFRPLIPDSCFGSVAICWFRLCIDYSSRPLLDKHAVSALKCCASRSCSRCYFEYDSLRLLTASSYHTHKRVVSNIPFSSLPMSSSGNKVRRPPNLSCSFAKEYPHKRSAKLNSKLYY
jgi:hypothetical protein